MPIVLIPKQYRFGEAEGQGPTEVRVSARTRDEVYRELAARFPHAQHQLLDAAGRPGPYFNLYRDSDGEETGYYPDAAFGDDERLLLIYAIAG